MRQHPLTTCSIPALRAGIERAGNREFIAHSARGRTCDESHSTFGGGGYPRDRPRNQNGEKRALENLMDYVVENFATIATVLLTAAVSAYFLWRNNFKTRRANACAAFRSAIDREIGSVSTAWPDNIDKFLRSRYPALLTAVREFKHYVPWWQKRGFDRAWLCFYCAYPDKWDSQCYHHYFDSYDPLTSSQSEATKKCKELFHANVERLLSYAKET